MLRYSLCALLLTLVGLGEAVAQSATLSRQATSVPVAPALPAAPAPANGPAPDWAVAYAATITAADLEKHLRVLASDEYEGRETGEKGAQMAAEYIAQYFRTLGLTDPVPNPVGFYRQSFALERSRWATDQMQLRIQDHDYPWLVDFFSSGDSPFTEATSIQPLFVGYGIEQDGYSDYQAIGDVKGCDLVALLGEPTRDGKALLNPEGQPTRWGRDSRAKVALATEKGARSIIFINPDAEHFAQALARFKPYIERPRIYLPGAANDEPARVASFLVSPAVGLALLHTTPEALARYQAAIDAAVQPVKAPFKPRKVTIRAPRLKEPVTTENVAGYLEGTDKKDELLIISAHYDHLGIADGKVFNGADDDGSGTVAVLEMAQAWVHAKAAGHAPRRSILFLALTGEEKGLLGSEYYTLHPLFPLGQTVTDLNIDMVGRTDQDHHPGDQYIDLVGSDKLSSELHALSEAANQRYTQLALDYRYNDPNDPEQVYYRSDHYNFARHKIPVIFYTTGDHADYHQETDEVDRIEFPLFEKRVRLVFYTAWEVANRDERPKVDSNKP